MSTCPSVLAHGASCTKACDSGYTLAGTQPSCDDGTLTDSVECIEDIDCVGVWSVCTAGCAKQYSMSVAQSGSGSSCPAAHEDDATCNPGEGNCPSNCTGLTAPAHGSMSTCPSVLGHNASCAKACDSGYTLSGAQPSCDDGTLTDSVECIEDIDCVGAWSVCTENCSKEYNATAPTCVSNCSRHFDVSVPQSGSGVSCGAQPVSYTHLTLPTICSV